MLRPFVLSVLALGTTLGCSDPPPRPAKLGISIELSDPALPDLATYTCGTQTGITWDIGNPSPTTSAPGRTSEDGSGATSIQCTVRTSGAFRAIGDGQDAAIAASPTNSQNASISFNMSGTARINGAPATNAANLSLYTPVTFQIGTEPAFPRCTMTTVHDLKGGALWADFNCPALTDNTRPNTACEARGSIVLEYCQTGEEEE